MRFGGEEGAQTERDDAGVVTERASFSCSRHSYTQKEEGQRETSADTRESVQLPINLRGPVQKHILGFRPMLHTDISFYKQMKEHKHCTITNGILQTFLPSDYL